jgi:hypothetical protein
LRALIRTEISNHRQLLQLSKIWDHIDYLKAKKKPDTLDTIKSGKKALEAFADLFDLHDADIREDILKVTTYTSHALFECLPYYIQLYGIQTVIFLYLFLK